MKTLNDLVAGLPEPGGWRNSHDSAPPSLDQCTIDRASLDFQDRVVINAGDEKRKCCFYCRAEDEQTAKKVVAFLNERQGESVLTVWASRFREG